MLVQPHIKIEKDNNNSITFWNKKLHVHGNKAWIYVWVYLAG